MILSSPHLLNDADSCPEWSHIKKMRLIIFSKCGKAWPPNLDLPCLALAAFGGSACQNISRLQICFAQFLLEIASNLLGLGWLGWLGLPWPSYLLPSAWRCWIIILRISTDYHLCRQSLASLPTARADPVLLDCRAYNNWGPYRNTLNLNFRASCAES